MKSYNRFQIKATKTITFCGKGAAYISLICYLSIKSFYNFFLSVKAIKINKTFVFITWFIILWDFHKLVSHMWQDTVMARRTSL